MTEYIDREAAIKTIEGLISKYPSTYVNGIMAASEALRQLPADGARDLKRDLRDCRNELCLQCGKYKFAHRGECNGCRWKDGVWNE